MKVIRVWMNQIEILMKFTELCCFNLDRRVPQNDLGGHFTLRVKWLFLLFVTSTVLTPRRLRLKYEIASTAFRRS